MTERQPTSPVRGVQTPGRLALSLLLMLLSGVWCVPALVPSQALAHSADFSLTDQKRSELQSVTAPIALTTFELLEVRRAVRLATMRPDTARFGDIGAAQVLGTAAVHVCGYVDGENPNGDMVGYLPFYLLVYDGLADFDRVEIAEPGNGAAGIAAEHSACGGAAPLSAACAFQSVETILREVPEPVPSRNSAKAEEIEAFCRAVNIRIAPPQL